MKFSNIFKRSLYILLFIQIAAVQNFIYPVTKNTNSAKDKVAELTESIDAVVNSVPGTVSIQVTCLELIMILKQLFTQMI